jgi:hypothetical protein
MPQVGFEEARQHPTFQIVLAVIKKLQLDQLNNSLVTHIHAISCSMMRLVTLLLTR